MRNSGFTGSGQLGQNPGVPGQGGTVNNVVVNNTFPTPPADPHTFSQGVAYELQAAL
jgi:hypothetical protein